MNREEFLKALKDQAKRNGKPLQELGKSEYDSRQEDNTLFNRQETKLQPPPSLTPEV